jgi:hypothetical protein
MAFTLPTIDQCAFTIECLEEDTPVKGSFASGEDELDRGLEASILERLQRGDTWAWCVVKVTAEYRGFEGTDYLGGCSYESEANFITSNDYYQSMRAEAFDRLCESMLAIARRLGCEVEP